jgi:Xaa-Pro aminopeptidase
MAPHAERLAVATERLAGAGLDALLVPPSPDLVYLTGYEPMPLERPTVLILVLGEPPRLLVPALERPEAEAAPAAGALAIAEWRDGTDPYRAIGDALPPGGRVAAGDQLWAAHLLALQALDPARRWVSASPVLAPLRMRKDPDELAALRRAAHAADASLAALLTAPLEGRTERAVAATLAEELVAHGHTSAAFAIVASGPNAASPHHEPTERPIARGDAVVVDFGGRLEGYHSDLSRTVVVGEPDAALREVHAIVAEAQRAAREAARPGVPIEDVDRAARAVIAEAGYGERFLHRTGHGIGIEVHEPPYAVAGDRTPLEPGMTFSVEPGIYLDGRFGVRIEDIVAVTAGGIEVLNDAPRELRSVG